MSETYLSLPAGSTTVSCGDLIAQEFADLYALMATPAAWPSLKSKYNLCGSVRSAADVYLVVNAAKFAFGFLSEFSYPVSNPATGVPGVMAAPTLCAAVATGTRIATGLSWWYNPTGDADECIPVAGITPDDERHSSNARTPSYLDVAGWNHKGNQALPIQQTPWSYICCQQFVQPIAGQGIFAAPLSYDYERTEQRCRTSWPGVQASFSPLEWWLNFVTPAVLTGSRVMWVNGGFDPVRSFSPNVSLSPADGRGRDLTVLNVPDMGHTYDLFSEGPMDAMPIVAARASILAKVKAWLAITTVLAQALVVAGERHHGFPGSLDMLQVKNKTSTRAHSSKHQTSIPATTELAEQGTCVWVCLRLLNMNANLMRIS